MAWADENHEVSRTWHACPCGRGRYAIIVEIDEDHPGTRERPEMECPECQQLYRVSLIEDGSWWVLKRDWELYVKLLHQFQDAKDEIRREAWLKGYRQRWLAYFRGCKTTEESKKKLTKDGHITLPAHINRIRKRMNGKKFAEYTFMTENLAFILEKLDIVDVEIIAALKTIDKLESELEQAKRVLKETRFR